MKNTNKIVLLSIIGFLLIGSYLTLGTAQEPPVNPPIDIGENQYEGSIAGNETSQFTFQHKFRFNITTNASLNLDMDVDVDSTGNREFKLEIQTQEQAELTIRINGSDESLGLKNGSQIQVRNGSRYRYQERFRLNISCNGTVQANLSVNTNDPKAQWAYYDGVDGESMGEWVTVPSSYQNGVLTAETSHFSVWTVLTLEEDSIPSYPLIGLISVGSIMGLLFIAKRKK
ncbi:hypothetical protein DSAG12_02936 [Promethearchaeum syntrophicum]|uniref:Uncharacterized protein n=1 Tax=Promethearchaeum syntrophicum TaxID=2594042 RepID=A0A5B9DDA5_9ARCH|nr:hypothetical protein [Candidatus Prometheoarchaeum syntrophicum]QEE17104.1 hypothetical protein DSAG12_02936 [Candidatus Prometheoarchaeum syntrophicum]